MNPKPHAFTRSYLASLRKYLCQGSAAQESLPRNLGKKAVNSGLETLDLAKVHEQALIDVLLSVDSEQARKDIIRTAGAFFTEAITPIEETHRGAIESNSHLKVMIDTLTKRTQELADSNEELKCEIAQRKCVEDSLRTSEQTSSKLLVRSRQMHEELRLLSRRLLSVQEDERKRISRELHDVVAQALTGINMRLATLKTQTVANTKDFQKKIETTQRLVEKSVETVHRFARDLRPAVLDDLGLIPALQSFMKTFMEETGVRVSCTAFAGVEQLDNEKRTVLYRVAQEALSNIAKHAQASRAEIVIQKLANHIGMKIQDNGSGFEVDGLVFTKSSNRLGLLGMRERVEMVGGTFCINSSPGNGATLLIELPLDKKTGKQQKAKSSPLTSLVCP